MTVEQKIDYMIQSLQLAKEEIVYTKEYMNKREKDDREERKEIPE